MGSRRSLIRSVYRPPRSSASGTIRCKLGKAHDEITHNDAVITRGCGQAGQQIRSDGDAAAVRSWPCQVIVADVVLRAPRGEGKSDSLVVFKTAGRPRMEPEQTQQRRQWHQ